LKSSPALTASLEQLAQTIPQLRKDIQDGLLKTLSIVLMGKPLRHPGAPKTGKQNLSSSSSSVSLTDSPDSTTITLALRTLGSFDFEG